MREKRDVLIISPACCSTRLQHLWVTPCLHYCASLCAPCAPGIGWWESRRRAEIIQDVVERVVDGGGVGTETEWGCWKQHRKRVKNKQEKEREGEGSVKEESKGVEEWGIEGVCLPRSEQAVLSSSSSLCPRWLCLWPGPAVAIIRHK